MTVSPSIPTGISGTSASTTTTSSAARVVTPWPPSSSTARTALFTVTAMTPSVPLSSRVRWPSPAMSPVSYALLLTSSACGSLTVTVPVRADSLAPLAPARVMAGITARKNLNPARRHRTYPASSNVAATTPTG